MSYTAAIIGGTGLCDWEGAEQLDVIAVETPYGATSAAVQVLRYEGAEFLFLARHGQPHRQPPHKVNYRANIWALAGLGVPAVLAVNAVGGIGSEYGSGVLMVPDQLIDYTWGREHSFFDGSEERLEHIDFTEPYTRELRELLLSSAKSCDITVRDGGVYGATQGPRLETAAEVRCMARDGCDVVGMTGMPEAALAREAGLAYASLCLVVNPAAGESDGVITMDDIQAVIGNGMGRVKTLLARSVLTLAGSRR